MVRLKHRYLLVNILYPEAGAQNAIKAEDDLPHIVQFHQPSSDQLTARVLLRIIRDGVAELFGDYGSGMISGSLLVKYLSPATSTAIVRVSRAHYRLVWAALSFVTHLPKPIGQACVMQVVRVSGTIRKSEEEAIRRARASILRANRAAGKSDLTIADDLNLDISAGAPHEDLTMMDTIEDKDEPGDEDEASDEDR